MEKSGGPVRIDAKPNDEARKQLLSLEFSALEKANGGLPPDAARPTPSAAAKNEP